MFKLLNEFVEDENKKPTYAALTFDKESVDKLKKLLKHVPNPTQSNDFHVTVLYSRTPISYRAEGKLEKPIKVKVIGYDIFKSQSGKNCIVLKLAAEELVKRHEKLMKETGASYDHDEYKPHVTLTYDAGDVDLDSLPSVEGMELTLDGEYSEELDPD